MLRATGLLILLTLPVAGVIAIMSFYRDALMPSGEASIFQMLWLIFFVFSFLIILPLSIVLLVVAAPLLVILSLQILLAVTELLLRRSVEYQRGPIVAISLLVAASAALLKALI